MRVLLAGIGVLLLVTSCDPDDGGGDGAAFNPVPPFLNAAVDLMEANALRRDSIDWVAFREQVLAAADGATDVADADAALLRALELLGDNHSFVVRPDGTFVSASTADCSAPAAARPSLPDSIGYVRVPRFSGSAEEGRALAEGLHASIARQDSAGVRGWIVDLRGNLGGNMWPMLAGVGPVLGESIAGSFSGPDGGREAWSYAAGGAFIAGSPVVRVDAPYTLREERPRVAVLLDNAVASSGEAIAISFVGRDDTRSFGAPTCGISTANSGFDLTDGSRLLLTTAYMLDRDGRRYGGRVRPDSVTSVTGAVTAAVAYLRE